MIGAHSVRSVARKSVRNKKVSMKKDTKTAGVVEDEVGDLATDKKSKHHPKTKLLC